MPTNEERREVAARLRRLSGHREVDKEFVHEALGLYMGECVDGYDPVSVSELADLIEPTVETCELELTWGGHTNAHVRTYECSRCGKSCDSVWGEDYEFCPYCGRRVENADE